MRLRSVLVPTGSHRQVEVCTSNVCVAVLSTRFWHVIEGSQRPDLVWSTDPQIRLAALCLIDMPVRLGMVRITEQRDAVPLGTQNRLLWSGDTALKKDEADVNKTSLCLLRAKVQRARDPELRGIVDCVDLIEWIDLVWSIASFRLDNTWP